MSGQTVSRVRIAIDIGGTFTDLQIANAATGEVYDFKSPSTPDDPARGLIAALNSAAERFGFQLNDISMLLHGSTIATNAVLERKLPRGALITTAGFEDVLEIGRHMRSDVYGLKAEGRSVLIPRTHRFGVGERMRADGSVETPLDVEGVRAIGKRLVADGITTVAVAFFHAYRNPAHEIQAADVLSEFRDLSVATSYETSPEIREFERTSTTVLNALLKPVISSYLERLEDEMRQAGVDAPLYLVQSNGGVVAPADAARLPVKLLLSGPAGGAMAMAGLAATHCIDNLVGIDMGGTSSDVSVVQGGTPGETSEGEIDGLPVRVPMIEIRTIGAGGGSIARAENGALRVGPESAGAMPGPACYRRGGTQATVTDANLALGRIDAAGFLGGNMLLDAHAATETIKGVAADLQLTNETAASGIIEVANASMAGAVRLSLFEKGADPSDFVLVPFGGAGGLHACSIANELDINRILFPAAASTLSARGILMSGLRHDFLNSELCLAEPNSAERLNQIVFDLHASANARLRADGIAGERQAISIAADCRYRGQAYEITTPWHGLMSKADASDTALLSVDPTHIAELADAFHALHLERYAHNARDEPVEIVTVRAIARGRFDDPASPNSGATADVAIKEASTPQLESAPNTRRVHLNDRWEMINTYRREELACAPVSGPALIQEDYATLLIEAGWEVTSQSDGALLAVRSGDADS